MPVFLLAGFCLPFSFQLCKKIITHPLQVRKQEESRSTDTVSTELLSQIDRLTQSLAQAQDDGSQALSELQGKYISARRSAEEAEEHSGSSSIPPCMGILSVRYSLEHAKYCVDT